MHRNVRSVSTLTLFLALAARAEAQVTTPPAPKLGGYIQARSVAHPDVGVTSTLNRARFSIDGPLPSRFSYRILVELQAPSGATTPAAVGLREAIIRWSRNSLGLNAGQMKTPFTREYLIPVPAVETPDLAVVVDSLSPKYDIGVQADYAFGPFGSVTVGAFNGEGQNASANRDSSVLIVARAVARPIPLLSFGASGARDDSDSLRWGVEAQVEQWGGMVRAEYLTRHRKGRDRSRDDFGWYVFGIYRVHRQVSAVARIEDFQRPELGEGRRVTASTLGALVELVPNRVRLLLDTMRKAGGPRHAATRTWIGQLQVRF